MTQSRKGMRGAPKGTMPPNAGIGRKAGVPNKLTGRVRAMIEAALEAAGGADYLLMQAYAEPVAFMALVSKLIPLQVGVDPDDPLTKIEIVRTIVQPKKK